MDRQVWLHDTIVASVDTTAHVALDCSYLLETGHTTIIIRSLFVFNPSELANALTVVRVPLLAMASTRDLDSIHDEYGPAEVLEAVIVKFQRASPVSIKAVIQSDEARSCLALLGMRWLNSSEIKEDSRRRNPSRRTPGASQYPRPTHAAAGHGIFVPAENTSESIHQTETECDKSDPCQPQR